MIYLIENLQTFSQRSLPIYSVLSSKCVGFRTQARPMLWFFHYQEHYTSEPFLKSYRRHLSSPNLNLKALRLLIAVRLIQCCRQTHGRNKWLHIKSVEPKVALTEIKRPQSSRLNNREAFVIPSRLCNYRDNSDDLKGICVSTAVITSCLWCQNKSRSCFCVQMFIVHSLSSQLLSQCKNASSHWNTSLCVQLIDSPLMKCISGGLLKYNLVLSIFIFDTLKSCHIYCISF